MDTSRSDAMAKAFLAKGHPYKRKIQVTEHLFHASPEVVFEQLCPTREADWIEGWKADLIYTTTGYMQEGCIFTTPPSNVLGPGVWVVVRSEPNKLLDVVRIIEECVVEHFTITLVDNDDGTCTGTWTLRFTALNERGNAIVNDIPEEDPSFTRVLSGLEHFVTTGSMLPTSESHIRDPMERD